MRIKLIACAIVATLSLVVATASACPDEKKGGCSKTAKLTKSDAVKTSADAKGGCNKPCGAKKTITVAGKASTDGRSEPTVTSKKGGCSKPCGTGSKGGSGAKTVASKDDKTFPCPLTGKQVTEEGCPISKKTQAVLTSMPSMKYRVGEEVTCCSKTAAAIAEKSGKKIEYVVGEKTLADKGEAVVRLATLLDGEATSLSAMQFAAGGDCYRCPVSAKDAAKKSNGKIAYRVGGFDFDSKTQANDALDAVEKALATVTMAYKVDGKTYHCNQTAGSKCKESGKKLTYVVGADETPCQQTAKLMLAEAKVRTIVETAAAQFRLTL